MQEKWIKWEPTNGLSEKYYVESVCNIIGPFKITLVDIHDKRKKVIVIFEDSVDGYRLMQEDLKISKMHQLQEEHSPFFYQNWTFFKIKNSEYIKWIVEESANWSDYSDSQHFVLWGKNSIVDIVNYHEPKIVVIDENEKPST